MKWPSLHSSRSRSSNNIISTFITCILATTTHAQSSITSKRGLAYHYPVHSSDYNIFFTPNSSITWYFNWSPWPSRIRSSEHTAPEFIPMIHGISNLAGDISTIQSLSPKATHIFTFNEPDGSVASGGSNISPHDAAQAYVNSILPLRSSPPNYLISHPVVTGSGNGLSWLKSFNTSCWALNPAAGCPLDFINAHWYGDFGGLASWLGTLHAFYGGDTANLPIYVTEFALPQANALITNQMLDQSLPFLDATQWVAKYAWFGLFRTDEANEWTGDGVSLLDDNGGLTSIGATYLGGEAEGYTVGMKSAAVDMDGGGDNGNGGIISLGIRFRPWWSVVSSIGLVMCTMLWGLM